jgi:Cytochrome c554 and c-prime
MRAPSSIATAVAGALILSCGGSGGGGSTAKPIDAAEYKVFAWNDLGMHCLNPSYDQLVILPPYNTLWAQVVRRGNPPAVVTSGVTVEYALAGNTSSYGKAGYGQFWDHALALFGVAPARDHGLNLVAPGVSNGLAGAMVAAGDHFEADGVPVVPMGDDLVWNPYQVAQITVKDAGGNVLATAQATVPTSDELDCAKCHGADPFADILAKHAAAHPAATLVKPVLCASCHASPALGVTANHGGATTYLSQAIHGFHGGLPADQRPACYDCHPGAKTQCSRSLAHTAPDGNCTHCHGTLPEVAASIAAGRVPWVSEPACLTCHAGVPEVDTGTTLYRHAKGHGGVSCPACHGSPHAMFPSRVASDQAQPVAYQGAPLPIGDCNVCHATSRGGGLGEFDEAHAGPSAEAANACRVCHTVVPGAAQVGEWPHGYGWKTRSISY